MVQERVIFAPQETHLPATQGQAIPLEQEKAETARDLKSSGDRLTCSGSGPFLYAASLHNFRDGIKIYVPTESKVRRGRYVAQHIDCPEEVDEMLQRVLLRLSS